MTRTTRFRRTLAFLAVSLLAAPGLTRADAQAHPLESIRAAAEAFVVDGLPKGESGRTQVKAGALDSRLRLAPCTQPLRASLPTGATFRHRMTVAVSCTSSSKWTVYVPVVIESRIPVLVLRSAAPRGARLTAADVEVQERTVSGPGKAYVTDVAQLARRTLRRPLAAGTVLTVDALAEEPLVRRGQQVTLLALAGGIEVRAPGRALSDGYLEGRVRAQNLSSHQVVEGVVQRDGVIRVAP